jgi:hypothetical protein
MINDLKYSLGYVGNVILWRVLTKFHSL